VLDGYLKSDYPHIPLHFYYQAYLETLLGGDYNARDAFLRAKSADGPWDFPFRLETEKVLKRTVCEVPDDYNALYHLGNLLASKGRYEEAISCYERVKGDNSSMALRCRGLIYWQMLKKPELAIKIYAQAVAAGSCGAKTLCEYDQLLEEADLPKKRLDVLSQNKELAYKDKRLLLRMVSALVANEKCEEALNILRNNSFILCEGKVLPRLLFEASCRTLGEECLSHGDLDNALDYYKMPLEYLENLGVGKPSANMESEWWWRAGKILQSQGRIDEAKKYFQSGAEAGDDIGVDFFPLKEIVWEHGPASIDIRYLENESFQLLCATELEEKTQVSVTEIPVGFICR